MTAQLDAILADTLAATPAVVAMATNATETIYEGAAGTRDAAGRVPMTVDTVFGLASMTKALVSAEAMRLVDAGRLSLDGPLADVLPALANPRVLEGFAADGRPLLRPARGRITLRHVLTHSAGFGYDTWNEGIKAWLAWEKLPRVPESAEQLARTPLLFDPGTDWAYGIGTDVVGLAVEAASGRRLDEQLAQGLFAALGMTDTTAALTDEQRGRLVTTRARDGSGWKDLGFIMDRPRGWCLGGGSLLGSGRDYLRFIRMVLNGGMHEGERVLSPAAMVAMTTNQLEPGVAVRKLFTANPSRSNDVELFPGVEKHWTAAFMRNSDSGRLAWAGIGNTYFWIDLTRGIGGVFLTQTLPFADPATLAAMARFEAAVSAL